MPGILNLPRLVAGGLLGAGPQSPPAPAGKGLLTPVIWDRLQQQRGINPMTTTEGARPLYAGGGSGEGAVKWRRSPTGVLSTTDTPSGARVTIERIGDDASVRFKSIDPSASESAGSTKQGLNTFSDVFSTIKDYVSKFDPKRLHFSALTDAHEKLYDRVAPMMADHLGGVLHVPQPGVYSIHLPPDDWETDD